MRNRDEAGASRTSVDCGLASAATSNGPPAAENPFVFIVGCSRSGTTLLRRILDAHPHVAIAPEQHWVPELFEERIGVTPEGFVRPELVSRVLQEPNFLKLEIGEAQLRSLIRDQEPLDYSRFVAGVFDLYGELRGKPLVGEKTPGYVRKIPTLHALWPAVRFVHVIRDGRDVCLSANNWTRHLPVLQRRFPTWTRDPVVTAALWWKWHVRLGRQVREVLGPQRYHELSYESLIVSPEAECSGLCAFLDLPYDDAMLRFHEGRTRTKPGLSAKKAWLPVTPGLMDWRSQMPGADVERFEAAAGDALVELGYAPAFPRQSAVVMEHVAEIRELFTADLRARKQPLPEGW